MLLSYLKTAIRSILRSRLTATINISGLAIALTCCLLIYMYVSDELKYDRYHENADRIYRVTRNFLSPDGTVHLHLGHLAPPPPPPLQHDLPDILEAARTPRTGLPFPIEENGE